MGEGEATRLGCERLGCVCLAPEGPASPLEEEEEVPPERAARGDGPPDEALDDAAPEGVPEG